MSQLAMSVQSQLGVTVQILEQPLPEELPPEGHVVQTDKPLTSAYVPMGQQVGADKAEEGQ